MSQIITINFREGRHEAIAAEPLEQWAYGQKILFTGIELPEAYQVDFSNYEFCGTSIPRIGGADGVSVPVEVLASGRNVYAFIWSQDETSGRRPYRATIRVIPGPIPNPEEPNPEEESMIGETLAALNEAADRADEAKQAAEAAADASRSSAEAAAASADGAATSAQDAADSAQDAADSVSAAAAAAADAAGHAQDAAASASAASGSAQAAEASVGAAATSAQSSANSAAAAAGFAASAQTAAGDAAAQAQDATTRANAAAASATDAAGSAQAAQDAADAAEESAQAAARTDLTGIMTTECAVQRVAAGTQIRAKFTARKICAPVGFFYNPSTDDLSIYGAFALQDIPEIVTRRYYVLFTPAAAGEPVELTAETAGRVNEVNANNAHLYAYKARFITFSATRAPLDVRFLAVALDANGQEIDRVYSAQYRYEMSGSAVTRTRFQTAPTAADHVVELGLIDNDLAVVVKYGEISSLRPKDTILSLVATEEPANYQFVIPDSFFDAAPLGFSLAVVSGTNVLYRGHNVNKATPDSTEWNATVSTGFENLGVTAELNGTSFTKASTMSFSPEQLDGATFTLGSDTITVTQSMLTDLSAMGITGTLIDIPGFGPVVFSCTEAGSVVSEPGLYMATDAISYAPMVTMSYTATLTATYRMIATGTMEMEDGVTDLPSGVIYLQLEG